MAMVFQLTVDCHDPHQLADWWAETLEWEVEPSDPDFIRAMVAQGHAGPDDTTTYRDVLVWRTAAAVRHPDSGTGPAGRILFQLVPEPKTVKNRLHLDVRPGARGREAVVESLVARGATVLHHGRQGPHTWTTLADPEGNEFCVG